VSSDTLAASTVLESAPHTSVWKKLISLPAALGVLLAGGIFVPLSKFQVDPDTWWHIRVGASLLSTHQWPTTDPYSFTAHGSPWIAYEWLGDVVLATAQRAGGLQGLMLLDLVLACAILLALYGLATLRCGNSKAAFVACAVVLPLVYPFCSLRPQMLGYCFLVLTLIVLERFRQGRKGTLWLLPLLFLAWVNSHGSFVLGFLAMGVYWASGLVEIHWGGLVSTRWTSEERLRLELAALLSLVALTITPYGTQLCVYPLDMAFSQPINVANIQEWQSMMFAEFFGKLFLALVIGFLLAQVTLRLTWRLEELVLFLAGVVAACLHVRFLLIFVPFAAPLLAVIVARGLDPYQRSKDKYILNAILMLLTIVAVIRFFPTRSNLETLMKERWPVGMVAYLRQHPAPAPVLNSYGFGGYLIWQMSDRMKVFVDGRADIYERTGVLADYLAMARLARPAPYLLNTYNIQSCLLDRRETLVTLLDVLPGWQKTYSDPVSVLYVRKQPSAERVDPGNDAGAVTGSRLLSPGDSSR
jgi:hypothetical protein